MVKLNNVVKRRKTANYLQINNFPIQEDLGDLQAIGLLTYIMSLPEDWELHKTYLQSVFTRRTVESAWKILSLKRYAIGFSCYLEGNKGKQYFYNVSDMAFTQEDYNSFVFDVISLISEDGKTVSNIEAMKDSTLVIPTEIFNVQNVQYKLNSIKRTDTKELITKTYKTKTHSLSIANYQEPEKSGEEISATTEEPVTELSTIKLPESLPEEVFTEACNEFYSTFAIGRWNKKAWNTLVTSFVSETITNERHKTIPPDKVSGYVYKTLENMAKHHDYKHSEEFQDYKETMKEVTTDLSFDELQQLAYERMIGNRTE